MATHRRNNHGHFLGRHWHNGERNQQRRLQMSQKQMVLRNLSLQIPGEFQVILLPNHCPLTLPTYRTPLFQIPAHQPRSTKDPVSSIPCCLGCLLPGDKVFCIAVFVTCLVDCRQGLIEEVAFCFWNHPKPCHFSFESIKYS